MNRLLDRPVPVAPSWPGTAQNGAERQLMDELGRIGRGGARPGQMLLVLHLSRLPPPGMLPFHGRVAAALLAPAAAAGAGRLFTLAQGDVALLFRPTDGGGGVLTLVRTLFGSGLTHSAWRLPEAVPDAVAFVAGQMAARAVRPGTASVPRAAPVLRRQVAVALRPGAREPILPLFREWAPEGDTRLVPEVVDAVLAGLDGASDPLPTHLNTSVAGVLGTDFARLLDALAVRDGCSVLAAEVPLADAAAEPNGLVLARERLRLAGARFVLDGVTAELLPLVRPEVLDPHLVKLGWGTGLRAGGRALAADLRRIGLDRLVLTGCEDEAAVVWGRAAGIGRFQGAFIDRALAAARMERCRAACGLAACQGRAEAARPEEREGCLAPELLEAGLLGAGPLETGSLETGLRPAT